MEIVEVDPSDLEIDPLNERNENVGPHKGDDSLEESIREQGLIQPPIARRDNGQIKVVVGQRRTLAAQTVGIDKIPVIVVDWEDDEALQASITENVDAFSKRVSRSDRAASIKELMDLTGWSLTKVGEELGVAPNTVRDWIERTRDEWEDTVVHVDTDEDSSGRASKEVETHTSDSMGISSKDVEQVSDTDLQTIRTATESPEERQKAVETIIKNELNQREIREARKRAERSGDAFDKVLEEVSQEREDRQGDIKVHTELTFTGDYAEGLQRAARDLGTSEEEIVRDAIREYLAEEGYI